jgi:hypothetical protein
MMLMYALERRVEAIWAGIAFNRYRNTLPSRRTR